MTHSELEQAVISHDRQIGHLIGALSQVAQTQLNQIDRHESLLLITEKTVVSLDKIAERVFEIEGKLDGLIDLVDRMIRKE